jgi:pimeloyl-ACP methyl ester carboxylesterase
MLAHDRSGRGEPLVLLHGTNSDRRVWRPLLPSLTAARDVINVDLPAHGQSRATSLTPPGFAGDLIRFFDQQGLDTPAVVGHSVGGWTALELAKRQRAGAVLALAPAGLWRRRSPLVTDLELQLNWRLGQVLGARVERSLRTRVGRRVGLRGISARPADVPAELAVETARAAIASRHFPEHFRRTRVLRFEGGDRIAGTVPVHVLWGAKDRVARARTSRHPDQLPAHARIEVAPGCGHMLMWDCPQRVIDAALAA